MGAVLNLIKDNILVFGIVLGLLLGCLMPDPGLLLKKLQAGPLFIGLIFFCQGMAFKPNEAPGGRELVRLVIWGLILSQVLGPLAGLAGAHLLPLGTEEGIGLILMCSMAPTLVSGAVLAERAGGDWAAAIILAVGLNLIAVLTIPLNLGWLLGQSVQIDAMGLLFKLVALVLVPALVGHGLGRAWPGGVVSLAGVLKYVPVVGIATLVYMSVASNNEALLAMEPEVFLLLLAAALFAHLLLLVMGYAVARRPMGLPPRSARSLAIVCSEKTLPLAVAVWTLALADQYPLSLMAAIVFHPTQVVVDGIIAAWWVKRPV